MVFRTRVVVVVVVVVVLVEGVEELWVGLDVEEGS